MFKRILLIVLSILGAGVMFYLSYLHFSPTEGAFCNLGEGLSCDIVNKSLYSEILGIPLSILGILFFLTILSVLIWKYNEKMLKNALFVSISFLGPSLYLTVIEIFVLKNICVFCELSKILILIIIILLIFSLKKKPNIKFFGSAIIIALIFAGSTYLIHSNTGPQEEYNSFAQCLNESGLKMYGSVTCSFCARQRDLFGDAFQFINEIECDPRNENNQAELCISKNIERTPTWILEDENGNNLHKFEPGVQSLKTLSEISNCPILKNK